MALHEEWILSGPIDGGLPGLLDGILGRVLPGDLEYRVEACRGALRGIVLVPEDDLHEIALLLHEPLDFFEGWDWEEEIDALDEGDVYELRVDLDTRQPETFESPHAMVPILSVHSKDGANFAAWPVAFILAARLAFELGAREPEGEAQESS